jgi:hypothetical protein
MTAVEFRVLGPFEAVGLRLLGSGEPDPAGISTRPLPRAAGTVSATSDVS